MANPFVIDQSDKLTIVNQALINTGNNPVAVADDNSDEWRVASSAFDQWARDLIYERDWNFAKQLANLVQVTSPPILAVGYTTVYAKPADCLFLINAWRTDLAALVQPNYDYSILAQNALPPRMDYQIVSEQIHCNAPNGARCLYIPFPTGAQPWSAGFVKALRLKVEAVIYRSLNDDVSASMQFDAKADRAIQDADFRQSSEEPRKVGFRSSALEARWRRRG
jgi:hypothetical protein